VAAVRHLVAQLAVVLARDLALVHHQIVGDESFADATQLLTANIAKLLGFSRKGWIGRCSDNANN